MEEQLIGRSLRRKHVHYLRLARHFWLLLCRETVGDVSTASSSMYGLGFRKPRRCGNIGDRAYIKHVRHKHHDSTRAEVIEALPCHHNKKGND